MGSLQKVRSKAEARNRSRFAETTIADRVKTAVNAVAYAVQVCPRKTAQKQQHLWSII